MSRNILGALLALGAASGASPAGADNVEKGQWMVMAFGGVNKPDQGGIHNQGVYGIRGGYGVSNRWTASLSLAQGEFGSGDQTVLDANLSYVFRPDRRFSMALTGGLGRAFLTHIDARDSFTLNAGFGPAIGINDRLLIRVLNRFRWFENRDDDKLDQEITIALMVKLGD